MFVGDKHTSLLDRFVSYEALEVLRIWTQVPKLQNLHLECQNHTWDKAQPYKNNERFKLC
jgi:hypothetical protein